jgi:hypothetical protein
MGIQLVQPHLEVRVQVRVAARVRGDFVPSAQHPGVVVQVAFESKGLKPVYHV